MNPSVPESDLFLSEIFGTDSSDDTELYSEAVLRGNYVLTVNVPDDDMVDRAPMFWIDTIRWIIDEQASNWKSGGLAAPESVRQNAGRGASNRRLVRMAIPVIREELKVGKRAVQRVACECSSACRKAGRGKHRPARGACNGGKTSRQSTCQSGRSKHAQGKFFLSCARQRKNLW